MEYAYLCEQMGRSVYAPEVRQLKSNHSRVLLTIGTLRSTTRWVDENAMKQQYHWLKEEK